MLIYVIIQILFSAPSTVLNCQNSTPTLNWYFKCFSFTFDPSSRWHPPTHTHKGPLLFHPTVTDMPRAHIPEMGRAGFLSSQGFSCQTYNDRHELPHCPVFVLIVFCSFCVASNPFKRWRRRRLAWWETHWFNKCKSSSHVWGAQYHMTLIMPSHVIFGLNFSRNMKKKMHWIYLFFRYFLGYYLSYLVLIALASCPKREATRVWSKYSHTW